MRVAIQGEPGSNSHLAVLDLLGEQTLVPCTISAEVFERLAVTRDADLAVLPIENSLHGAVVNHYDLLLEHDVEIVAETELRIRHALIAGPGVALAEVKCVLSHPVALSQCRRFFLRHPGLQAVPAYDTAGSVKLLMTSGEPDAAAIAAPYAAEVYGGNILERDLEDDAQNFTRFFLLTGSAEARTVREQFGGGAADKVSVAFAIPHRPGSLAETLLVLADAGGDLTRIESRPVPGRPWEYVFFADLRVSGPESASEIVDRLQAHCSKVKVLGLYRSSARNVLQQGNTDKVG